MKQLNTVPIEEFLDKARIARKSQQRQVVLDIKEVNALEDSLAVVMTRLAGELDSILASASSAGPTEVKMDGGGF